MVIYLRHEKHGTKVAISDLEAEEDKKNGWKEYYPGGEKQQEQESVNAIIKRRGRRKKAD